VVPVDGTPFSTTAIPTALQFAERLDASVHLFSAVDSVDAEPGRVAWFESLEVVKRRVEYDVVVDRDPAGAIHEVLRRLPGSIACMASHARVRTAAMTRSVLTELLVRGHDQVIAVGPACGDFAGWTEHQPPRGVVVGVDDNAEAAHLLEVAADWSTQLRERLELLTVAEPVPPPVVSGPVRRRYGPDDVDHFLRALVARARLDAVEVEPHAVYNPISPVNGIISWVHEHRTLLVVVGTAAPTGIERLAKGSTAAAITRESAAPVLVVPTRVVRTQLGGSSSTRRTEELAR
jgi:nucleotide-binding universal stress UspA family protein